MGRLLLLIVLAVVACGAVTAVAAAAHAQRERAPSLGAVLYGVGMKESGGRDVGLHDDRLSVGRYGVTITAVHELERVSRLRRGVVKFADLYDPIVNEQVAVAYLQWLIEREGGVRAALCAYHGKNAPDVQQYVTAVLNLARAAEASWNR